MLFYCLLCFSVVYCVVLLLIVLFEAKKQLRANTDRIASSCNATLTVTQSKRVSKAAGTVCFKIVSGKDQIRKLKQFFLMQYKVVNCVVLCIVCV